MTYSDSELLIINWLNKLDAHFPSVDKRYQYDSLSNLHLVELINHAPATTEPLEQEKNHFLWLFIDRFPDEGLLYITPETASEIDNPLYEKGALSTQTAHTTAF